MLSGTEDERKAGKPPADLSLNCNSRSPRYAERMIGILLVAGWACFALVVFTHIAEALRILPAAGRGLPDSPGHYLDLVSAISGVVLLVTAAVLRLSQSKRNTSKPPRMS